MTIEKTQNNAEVTLTISGRLDTSTAPQLEADINASLEGTESLILDFAALDYISSAGLRVLLSAQKKMQTSGGKMIVRGANKSIMEIFEITGFLGFLTIES